MIGIPTPTCTPSPNFNDTCTGLLAGFGGAVVVALLDALDEPEPLDPDDCVAVFVVPDPAVFDPHAETANAATTASVIRPSNGLRRCKKRLDITRIP